MTTSAYNRFFDGESVTLEDLKNDIPEERGPLLVMVLGVGYICGLTYRTYAPGGTQWALTGLGLSFYNVVKTAYEEGA